MTKRRLYLYFLSALLLVACKESKQQGQVLNIDKASLKADSTTVDAASLEADSLFNVDKVPMFKGGYDAMLKYIEQNIKYPEVAKSINLEGRVIVAAQVDKKGKLSNFSIVSSEHKYLNAEALRVVGTLPDFEPAMDGGKVVESKIKIPVFFSLK